MLGSAAETLPKIFYDARLVVKELDYKLANLKQRLNELAENSELSIEQIEANNRHLKRLGRRLMNKRKVLIRYSILKCIGRIKSLANQVNNSSIFRDQCFLMKLKLYLEKIHKKLETEVGVSSSIKDKLLLMK
jgi:hypothetical protein